MTASQTEFVQALLEPDARVPAGLTNPDGRPATKRFDVYRNNVAVSLTEALETAFPAVTKLIGDENFKRVAGFFLRKHPPSSPLMMFYGSEMPGFLEDFEPLKHLGYLADVARLEQAIRRSYHAKDATPIDPGILQSLTPDALTSARLAIAPAVEVLVSDWPMYSIWAYNMIPGSPKPAAAAEAVVVTRPGFDPEPHPVSRGAAFLIKELKDNKTLGDALETATQDPGFDFGTTLGQLLAGGAIIDVRTDT